MKVLLIQNVKNLGQAYDIKEVSDGYAINFLFAKKMAIPADQQTLQKIKAKKQSQNRENEKLEDASRRLKNKLINKTFDIQAKSNGLTLFSAVHENDIINAIKQKTKIELSANFFIISSPIKTLGIHIIEIQLRGLEKFPIKLNITPLS